MSKQVEAIEIAIITAERKARELKEALRQLRRIAGKHNRNERDVAIHEQMIQRIRAYDLTVPSEWLGMAW